MTLELLENRTLLAADLSLPHLAVLFAPQANEAQVVAATSAVGGLGSEKITLHAAPADYGQIYRVALGAHVSVADAIAGLRSNPLVKIAETDAVLTANVVSNDTYYLEGGHWGMYGPLSSPINNYGSQAADVWVNDNVGSDEVVVGVIDSGIDILHPDLSPNIWVNPGETANNGVDDDGNGFIDDVNGWDFFNNDKSVFDGVTVNDGIDAHGTHIAGTIGATGGNGIGVAGVNWNVKIIPAKFLGPDGGSTTAAIQAIDYLTALKNRGINIVAMNNSWGGEDFSQLLLEALGRSAQADMLFITGAGNSAVNNDVVAYYPSNFDTSTIAGYDSVVSVAALNSLGGFAYFSNYGPTTVDLMAPGMGIVSTTPFNTYTFFDGTSSAAAHVTGGAALYKSMNPSATPQQIRAALLGSALQTETAIPGGKKVVTNGRLNLTKLSAVTTPGATNVSIGNASIIEGDDGVAYVALTVTMDHASSLRSVVTYTTSNGTGLAGSDYVTTSGILTILQGNTFGIIYIPVYGDMAIEPNETFSVKLSNPVNVEITDGQGDVTIINDDYVSKLSVSSFQRLEGNLGYNLFVFDVSLSQPSVSTVTVRVATSLGTAADGVDYKPLAQTLTFAPGVTTQSVAVTVFCDKLFEPEETFYLDILSATNAGIKIRRGTATILNDDSRIPGAPPGSDRSSGGPPADSGGIGAFFANYLQPNGKTGYTNELKAKKNRT